MLIRKSIPLAGAALASLASLALLTAAAPAWSGGPPKRAMVAHVMSGIGPRAIGRSIGSPTEGHLVGGARLDETPYLRIVPVYASGDVRWGLEGLVSLLNHAGRAVHKQFPDAVMSVGHLSRPGGGEVERHASHESGRDADVGFYVKSYASKPLYADHFVAFRGDGTAPSWPGAHFDDARNWALVSSLVTDGHARITYIFVAAPLRARLLAYAERSGASPAIRQRAAELMEQPRGSLPHDDHFHVRIACPSGMEGCIELPSVRRDRIARAPRDVRRSRGATPAVAIAPPRPAHPSLPPRAPAPPPLENPPPAARPDPDDVPEAVPMSPSPRSPSPGESRPGESRPGESRPGEPAASPEDAPPASMSAPIDDVDGPVP